MLRLRLALRLRPDHLSFLEGVETTASHMKSAAHGQNEEGNGPGVELPMSMQLEAGEERQASSGVRVEGHGS